MARNGNGFVPGSPCILDSRLYTLGWSGSRNSAPWEQTATLVAFDGEGREIRTVQIREECGAPRGR
jgi:hypothetical protein